MDEQKLAKLIKNQCNDEDGFLIRLHSLGTFDEQQYQELISNLEAYRKALGSSTKIDRNLAGCLFDLMIGLDNAVKKYSETHPENSKIEAAQETVWLLIQELLSSS